MYWTFHSFRFHAFIPNLRSSKLSRQERRGNQVCHLYRWQRTDRNRDWQAMWHCHSYLPGGPHWARWPPGIQRSRQRRPSSSWDYQWLQWPFNRWVWCQKRIILMNDAYLPLTMAYHSYAWSCRLYFYPCCHRFQFLPTLPFSNKKNCCESQKMNDIVQLIPSRSDKPSSPSIWPAWFNYPWCCVVNTCDLSWPASSVR